MATLLLAEGVSWSHQHAASSPLLSSLHRPDFSATPCSCNRHCERLPTTRCAAPSSLIDRLDPPLPRLSSHSEPIRGAGAQRYRVILEHNPNRSQPYTEESSLRSGEPSSLDPWNNLEQPASPINRDSSNKLPAYMDGQERDMRRRTDRASPSYMSVSQARRAMANGATFQAVSAPSMSKGLKGASGFYVGVAAVMLGLMAILQKGGLFSMNTAPTTLCSSCGGYGAQPCRLCKGRGSISWEGKLKHTDLCPSCFGARIKKCSDCRGYRMRSDEPPFLRQRVSKARP